MQADPPPLAFFIPSTSGLLSRYRQNIRSIRTIFTRILPKPQSFPFPQKRGARSAGRERRNTNRNEVLYHSIKDEKHTRVYLQTLIFRPGDDTGELAEGGTEVGTGCESNICSCLLRDFAPHRTKSGHTGHAEPHLKSPMVKDQKTAHHSKVPQWVASA